MNVQIRIRTNDESKTDLFKEYEVKDIEMIDRGLLISRFWCDCFKLPFIRLTEWVSGFYRPEYRGFLSSDVYLKRVAFLDRFEFQQRTRKQNIINLKEGGL